MSPERAKALEVLVEEITAMIFDGYVISPDVSDALAALDVLPAEPADAGEMVKVRACVALQPDGRWNWIGFGNAHAPANDETLAEYALDFGAGNATVVAWTTARIPRPVVPEVRAEVET
jgi:hypothetical protein